MCTSEATRAGVLLGALALAAPALAQPELGQPVSEAELAAWDISIPPDGTGLPEGSGTAQEGAEVYAARCQSCHGAGGAGDPADPLTGGIGSLDSAEPMKTAGSFWPYATTLFDYTRRAMPLDAPQSLTDDEVYAVTAFILAENGIIADDAEMNAKTLPQVEMPNQGGFISWWPLPPLD
jgi:S-disulfanyl-L-cysteine oxidoreductase SoxD